MSVNPVNTDLFAPLPIEPYDKVWGIGVSGLSQQPSPFPRVNAMLQRQREAKQDYMGTVDAQRALIVTEGFQKYQAYPENLKWAMIFRDILQQVDIHIYPEELIVGELAAPANAAPVYPEFSYDWICDEIRNKPMDQRSNDKYYMDSDTKEKLLSLEDFWKGRTVSDAVTCLFTEEERKGSYLDKGVNLCALFIEGGVGHVCIDYESLFREGFGGIRRRILDCSAGLSSCIPEEQEKLQFYQASLIALEGASSYIRRYSGLAASLAEEETDPTRRAELLRISANCAQVAEGAPRDFWEALQLWQIATDMVIIESNGHSVTYGRFDQLFYPFYRRDLDAGTFTREFMQELIEVSFIKIDQLRKLRGAAQIVFASGQPMGGTALDVGGVDAYGQDCTNDLSYMVLDAHAHTQIPNPWLGVRLHEGTPEEFKIKTFNVIRIGTGEPKVFNDAPIIESLLSYGKSLEDARDYVGIGCVEQSVPAKTYGVHDIASLNLSKVMQLAINGGRCIDCGPHCHNYPRCAGAGKQLSINTGSLESFRSFDEVLASFDAQMKYWCDQVISTSNKTDRTQQRMKPLPYLSLLIQDCVGRGVDVSAGGAVYNNSGVQAVGLATAADSLSVIRQLVFEEKRVSGRELLDALRANWEGYESLYALVNSEQMHQYGNDDDEADELAVHVFEQFCGNIAHRPTPHGGEYMPGMFSVTCNVLHGLYCPATPDGRKAFEPVSDCLGPVHTKRNSHDHSGPTAIANSVTKLDHAQLANGVILNWKFSPSAVSGAAGLHNLIDLIDVYMEDGGMQSQFSIVGRDVLIEAQKHPENYRDLLVRIAGYSAYFVDLSRELQDDLIGRTELSFD